MSFGYYPGCSLHATARELDSSLRAVTELLGLELVEVDDWSCCGATSAHATNHLLALALAARNLSLAEAQGLDTVMAPCAACYSRLATAHHELETNAEVRARVSEVIERPFTNAVGVMNLVAFFAGMLDVLKSKAKPLHDLPVACYYGCLLVRPHAVTGADDPEAPTMMEDVARAVGAKPVAWNRALDCCGGGFSIPRTGSVVRLGRSILDDARAAGADAVIVACPMCHSNLDLRQKSMAERGARPLPILYLTELVGLGLGLSPERLGLERHFVSTEPVLAELREAEKPAAKAEAPA